MASSILPARISRQHRAMSCSSVLAFSPSIFRHCRVGASGSSSVTSTELPVLLAILFRVSSHSASLEAKRPAYEPTLPEAASSSSSAWAARASSQETTRAMTSSSGSSWSSTAARCRRVVACPAPGTAGPPWATGPSTYRCRSRHHVAASFSRASASALSLMWRTARCRWRAASALSSAARSRQSHSIASMTSMALWSPRSICACSPKASSICLFPPPASRDCCEVCPPSRVAGGVPPAVGLS
mmetsp:Transcript_11680/g.27757  ORF Transcript_11680/g.27757 Transcript_11680/m.27757 type:complete len:243 (+) Transcript_11680:2217-2945(+)